MEDIGIVVTTQGDMAKVLVQKRGVCEACPAIGTCKPSDEGMEFEALNPIRAKAGQTVKISLRPEAYLKGTMLLYGLPLLSLICGAILGKNLGELYFKGLNSDLLASIFGFGALAISFIAIKLWSSRIEKKERYKPVIEEIMP